MLKTLYLVFDYLIIVQATYLPIIIIHVVPRDIKRTLTETFTKFVNKVIKLKHFTIKHKPFYFLRKIGFSFFYI